MSLNYEEAERLVDLGEFEELRRCTDLTESGLRTIDSTHKVLVAQALALSGHLDSSRRVIGSVDESSVSAATRSGVALVRGLISEGSGALSEALEHFRLALRLASSAKDDVQIAWAQLRIFRHTIDSSSTGESMGLLPEVRRATARAATRHVSAYLHQCVAVLEGQIGRIDEARRHCDIVDSLLDSAPNAWLRGGNLVNRACLALLNCNYAEATGHLIAAKRYVARSGTRSSAIDSNLAHCQLMTGKFDEATATLNRVLTSERASHLAVLGALEELTRVHLAMGRLDNCEIGFRRIEAEGARDPALTYTFHIRWAAITKARLLLRAGRAAEAIAFLGDIESQIIRLRDTPLNAAVHLTMAHALVLTGARSDAARRLDASTQLGITQFRELLAPYYFVSSLVVEHQSPAISEQFRHRAFRLWQHHGNVCVPREMGAVPLGGPSLSPSENLTVIQEGPEQNKTASQILDAAAAVLDLAHTPSLMAPELFSLIDAVQCSDGVTLFVNANGANSSGKSVVIPLGNRDMQKSVLLCPVPNDAEKLAGLTAIAKLADAALTLDRVREEARARAALWPREPVEEEHGALFVAEEMQALLVTARRVAATNVPVLITGETGTGKEILARTIHGYSNRAKASFLPFNCTSTPKDMLDSQLFGHRRGSFTGATDNFQGIIRAAAGGTLFLDEIGDMGLDVQPKLLRFLESGEVHPIGDTQPHRVDVRVIAATNADLDALVTDGRFREDLFYRLNIIRLHLPPLRERRVEIPALANHYLQKYAQECGKGDLRLAEETMEYLMLFRWPGNVRQLANEMRRMAALCESGAVLMPEHLSPAIAASRRTIPASERLLDQTELVVRLDQPLAAATAHLERAMLQYALKRCGGRMEETASLLGLSRKGLYLKRQRFGIEPPEGPTAATSFDLP
jgi:DNA-binding NtrC family response regulator